jgi:hypothetical protein
MFILFEISSEVNVNNLFENNSFGYNKMLFNEKWVWDISWSKGKFSNENIGADKFSSDIYVSYVDSKPIIFLIALFNIKKWIDSSSIPTH